MFAQLTRPYKECRADETIGKIRGILENYDLSPAETFATNPYPEVYSVTLALEPGKGGFRANGKGRTKEFCLASAYAEFMERLQNGLYASFSRTVQSQLYHEFGFYYDPLEKFLPMEEFQGLPENILADLIRWTGMAKEEFIQAYFERLQFHKAPGTVAVPFHCSRSQREAYLPLNLLLMAVGSNGMAAGNNYEEALFQALCELMERWAAARVFYNRLTPPTIPAEYLKQFSEECQIIDSIEKSGKYKVIVKDFSAGQGIPAIGLIVHNVQQGTYRLNAGCDTSLQVALSRCLTEVFQGIQNEEILDRILLKIPTEDPPYFTSDDEASLNLRYVVFSQFTKDNTGVFPASLFGADPSYQFDASAFSPRGSYQQEVASLIEFFHKKGHTLYIRDVSFLGFPSVFVYIPEISSLGRKNVPAMRYKSTYDMIEWDKAEPKICKIKDNSPEDLLSLVSSLQTLPPYASLTDLLNIRLKETCPWSQLNISFLLAQLWFKLGEMTAAAEAFKVFQQGRPDNLEYYQAVGNYLDIRASGRSADEARTELEATIGKTNAVQQACDDLDNPDEVLKHLRLPECPDCSQCQLNADCLTKNLMKIARTVYPAMQKVRHSKAELSIGGLPHNLSFNLQGAFRPKFSS